MLESLIPILNSVGKVTELYESPDGSRVLVLPHGGRILGLFAPQRAENFYWTHPALASVETARAFYESGEWQNSGGDRTWLAPEADIFFPNFPELDRYWQPRQLDPGNYRFETRKSGSQLVNRLSLTLSRSQQQVELEISKLIGPAPNPLRYERGLPDVDYAGYTLHTTLRLLGTSTQSPVRLGLWNLVQLPHGGDLLVPTYSKAAPKVYMGSIAPEDLTVSDQLVRYRMRASGEHKIGIRAIVTTGRVGYLYSVNHLSALVIRNVSINPSGEYVDVPWTDTMDVGYSVQACNVKSHLGSFSELEYHSPAIGQGTGRTSCLDESQMWAFRGSADGIRFIAGRLLSPEA